MEGDDRNLTALLQRWSHGDASALDRIAPMVYSQLRALAQGYLRRERPGHTLQPTALIHEAYLRLAEQHQEFESRRQFYGVAARLMRIILVDHARSHHAIKRGGRQYRIAIENEDFASPLRDPILVELNEALELLAKFDERKSRAIELRYFGGLQVGEIAEMLDISVATLRRELRFAENWLYTQLSKQPQPGI